MPDTPPLARLFLYSDLFSISDLEFKVYSLGSFLDSGNGIKVQLLGRAPTILPALRFEEYRLP